MCVRARLRVRVLVCMHACARRRRIAEPSRSVQQAQAAGRAREAAKNYSSRNLKLRSARGSVGTSVRTVRAAARVRCPPAPVPEAPQNRHFGCVWGVFIRFSSPSPFVSCAFPPWLRSGKPARVERSARAETKEQVDEKGRRGA